MASKRKTQGRDFTGGALPYLSQHRGTTGDPKLDLRITELVRDAQCRPEPELIEELVITAIKLGTDGLSVADLKLINRTIREMRSAARVFAPYVTRRKVVVFGSARTLPHLPAAQSAETFAAKMVAEGYMVITGAGEGIMGAAQKGAGREASFGLNIKLPFEQEANPIIGGDNKLINFNYFFTRKLTFVKEAEAFALFPGGFGTIDEMFEVLTLLQTGKAAVLPVVLVDTPGGGYWDRLLAFIREEILSREMLSPDDLSLFHVTENVNEAVAEITRFYRVFHSYRYVSNRLVFRLNTPLPEEQLAHLNISFRDLLAAGEFKQGPALPAEASEPELLSMPRLIFRPQKKNFGRLRQLIDEVNAGWPR
ncbi:MAG: TIGR00730 family Rossman fold protein [Verrucomicrobiales bacterium]